MTLKDPIPRFQPIAWSLLCSRAVSVCLWVANRYAKAVVFSRSCFRQSPPEPEIVVGIGFLKFLYVSLGVEQTSRKQHKTNFVQAGILMNR